MNDLIIRRNQMFIRVRAFGVAHAVNFPPASLGGQLLAEITAAISTVDAAGTSQASGSGAARRGTSTKRSARAELRDQVEAISRTARGLAVDTPGLEEKFRMPRGNNDQLLLNSARAFASDAVEHEQTFIAHAMPKTFIADLNLAISAFEVAIDEQAAGIGERVGATSAIEDASENGVKAQRKFDVIVRNTFRDNPAALAEWTAASHLERAPKHKTAGTKETPPKASG